MFCALNASMRRQRRRLVVLALVVSVAGAVVVAHSAVTHDHHMADAVVTCMAVAETAFMAVGVALALGAALRRPLWELPERALPVPAFVTSSVGRDARAGPPVLGVFRL